MSLLAEDLAPKAIQHNGICDASGAMEFQADQFMVADDEINSLLVYSFQIPGAAIQEIKITEFLKAFKSKKKKGAGNKTAKVLEVDVEGASKIGELGFWISSHAQKKNGKQRIYYYCFTF